MIKKILAFLQGKIRYRVYYSQSLSWLIRKHIKEQIDMRISSMDKSCYSSGACMLCGCSTTALQMADKPCDKPCYPPMMNKKQWKTFTEGIPFVSSTEVVWIYKEDKLTRDYVG